LQHFGVDWDHPGAVPTGKEEAEMTINASDHSVLPAATKSPDGLWTDEFCSSLETVW
jgi:hypothetical protein